MQNIPERGWNGDETGWLVVRFLSEIDQRSEADYADEEEEHEEAELAVELENV